VWFSPDGRRILTNGPRRSAIVMDADGKRLHRLTPGFAFARPFSADGRLLALQSESRELAVWDAESGQRLARFAGSADGFERVMFDRAGTTVVSAADLSNEIRVQPCEACLPVADLIALARRRDRIARRDPAQPGSR
jgi:WD40 repeat protein